MPDWGELLVDQLRFMAQRYAGEVAYRDTGSGGALTFHEWDARSNALARGLVARGVRRGDRVSIYLPNDECLRWIVAYAAVHKAGAVAVPTNTRLSVRELIAILGHAEVRALLTCSALLPTAREVRDALPSLDLVVWTGAGWVHGAPLFTFAGISFIFNPMKMGMVGLYQPKFDAGEWLRIVDHERPTMAFLVPAMAELLVAHPEFPTADLNSLQSVSIGSAPLAPKTLPTLVERLPQASVSNSYGMTEAGPAFIVMPQEEVTKRIGSVGKPIPPMEIKIVDDNDNERGPHEIGELLTRLPGRQREY